MKRTSKHEVLSWWTCLSSAQTTKQLQLDFQFNGHTNFDPKLMEIRRVCGEQQGGP